AGGEGRIAEKADVEHRDIDMQLPEHEEDQDDGCEGEDAESGPTGPALVRSLDEPVDEGHDADDGQGGADRVELSLQGVLGARNEKPSGDESDDDDRDVDEEHRPVP